MVNGGPISWMSRQDNVSLSTSEVEFVTASLAKERSTYVKPR